MKTVINKFTCGHPEQMTRPVLWLFVENFFLSFSSVAVYFAINLIVQGFDAATGVDVRGLWLVAAVMGGLMLAQYALSFGAYWNTFMPATIHSAENKTAFIQKLRTLPLGFFMKKESGELINTFTGDFLAVEQSMVALFTGIFSVILGCALGAVFMFWFNPIMALAPYITIPITVVLIALSMRLIDKYQKRNIAARDKTATYLNEYLLGMKTLKAYNQTGEEFTKLKDAYQHLMRENIRAEAMGGTLLGVASTLMRLGLPLMILTGAYLILGGRLGVVEYLGLIVIGTKILSPLLTWVQYTVMLRMHYQSATRIHNVLNASALSGSGTANPDGEIRFENVRFAYSEKGDDPVLDGVSFVIPPRKLTAIVGPSGGGKSTILRLIARFWDVDGGRIFCDGKLLDTLDADRWIGNISMVLQDVYLFHDTIRENILFGRKDANEETMIRAAKRAQCHDFIMELPQGYDTIVGEGGSTLSGGEKQRISIARAILKDAPILLLDEPTASLDAKNEVLIQRAIHELVQGRTVVMIAHRLKTVQHAHQILVLAGGQVQESGSHDELMKRNGLYGRMWSMQNEAKAWNL